MEINTGIRALKRLIRPKNEKAGPAIAGRTADLNQLLETDEPDIMYLEETPAIYAKKKKLTADEVVAMMAKNEKRFHGKAPSHRLTLAKRLQFKKADASEAQTNHAKQRKHRIKRLVAYTMTSLAFASALLVFVLPEGGNAATEKIEGPAVVISHNPRIEQIGIDTSLLIEVEKTVQIPDAPDVTSMLYDETEAADAAAGIIDAAAESPEPTETETPTQVTDAVPAPMAMEEFVSYFVDNSGNSYDEIGYSTNSYDYTEEELYLLAQIITSEARGETFEGMVAVGNVVMNRVLNSDEFGSTIARVVKTGQFAYSGRTRPTPTAKRAAMAVLEDEYWVLPQNVYFFKSHSKAGRDWGRNDFYTKIKNHCFYEYSYSGRYDGDGIPPKLYERTYAYAQYGCTPSDSVLRIQQMLNVIGFHVNETGYFDKNTHGAMVLFQETNGLVADGIARPDTITALIKAYGFEDYIAAYVTEQAAA